MDKREGFIELAFVTLIAIPFMGYVAYQSFGPVDPIDACIGRWASDSSATTISRVRDKCEKGILKPTNIETQ